MWERVLIGVLAVGALVGCGADANLPVDTDVSKPLVKTADAKKDIGSSHPIYRTGQLPDTSPAFATLQTRVAADLAAGFGSSYFDGLPNPDEMIFRMGGRGGPVSWTMNDDKRVLHLVISHLREAAPTDHLGCADGRNFTGFAAARPYMREEFHSTAMQVTTVQPLKLHVCETGGTLTYALSMPAKDEL